MLLTIDRGNTSLDVMLHGEVPQRWRARASEPDAVLAALANLTPPPARAVGSTVVAGGLDAVAAVLQGRGLRLELAGRDLPCPLTLAYPDPTTLGTDRWLCALGAFRRGGAAVVVQCGTAITVDAVDRAGRFLGGAIAPGLAAMARGLADAAPRLPRFPAAGSPAPGFAAARVVAVPAVTSQDGVEAGVALAFCGAVERLIDEVAAALPPPAPCLITGGDAEFYLRRGRRVVTHVPDLLHQGLRWLAPTCGPRC